MKEPNTTPLAWIAHLIKVSGLSAQKGALKLWSSFKIKTPLTQSVTKNPELPIKKPFPPFLEASLYTLLCTGYLFLCLQTQSSLPVYLCSLFTLLLWKYRLPWWSVLWTYLIPTLFAPTPRETLLPEQITTHVISQLLLTSLFGYSALQTWKLTRHPQCLPPRKTSATALILLTSSCVGLTVFSNGAQLFHNLQTQTYDLGVFNNIFYNMWTGNGQYNPLERNQYTNTSHLQVHFSPSLFLLSPIYALWGNALGLIAIQALTIPSGCLCLYLLTKKILEPRTALLLSLSWCLYTPLLGGWHYDFHETAIAPPLLFLLGAAMMRNQYTLTCLTALILAGVKEDMPVFLAPAVVLFGYWSNKTKLGWSLAAGMILYFLLLKTFWISPHAENWSARLYKELVLPSQESLPQLVHLLLTEPLRIIEHNLTETKLLSLLQLLVPLAFLPLLNLWNYPLLAINILGIYSAHSNPFHTNHFQYSFSISALAFLAAIQVLRSKSPLKQNHLGALILGLCLLTQWNFGLLGGKPFRTGFQTITSPVKKATILPSHLPKQDYKTVQEELKAVLSEIPKDAIVSGDSRLTPHISNRKKVYMFEEQHWAERTQKMPPDERPEYVLTFQPPPKLEGFSPVFSGTSFVLQAPETLTRAYYNPPEKNLHPNREKRSPESPRERGSLALQARNNHIHAKRMFSSPLEPNDQLRVELQNLSITPGRAIQIQFLSPEQTPLLTLSFPGGKLHYELEDASGKKTTDIPYTHRGLSLTLSTPTPTSYQLQVGNHTFSGPLAQPPQGLQLSNLGAGAGRENSLLLGRLQILRDNSPIAHDDPNSQPYKTHGWLNNSQSGEGFSPWSFSHQPILTHKKRTKSLGIPLAQEGPYTPLIPATKTPETKPHATTASIPTTHTLKPDVTKSDEDASRDPSSRPPSSSRSPSTNSMTPKNSQPSGSSTPENTTPP